MTHHTIAVLLCTYNGVQYIEEQLRSLERQSCRNFDLYIRDDGSSDTTRDVIERFQAATSL
ncbi:MAG: glycosyltransferase family 2 protein, partial [Sulfurimonas sp.]